MDCRTTALVALITLTACATGTSGDAPPDPPDQALSDPRPVDMLYRAKIVQGASDCEDQPVPDYATTLVDAYLSADGTLRLTAKSGFVPGPGMYTGIRRTGSRIDHAEPQDEPITGTAFTHHLKGVLDPERIDLVIDAQELFWEASRKSRVCTNTVRLVGRARPLLDPRTLDGRYKVFATGSLRCPGQEDVPLGSAILPLDIDDDTDAKDVLFALDDAFMFSLPHPDASQQASKDGQSMYIVSETGFSELEGDVRGTLKPDALDLHLEYHGYGSQDPCKRVLGLTGSKVVPSLAQVENRYRVRYTGKDSCDGTTVDREETAELLQTPDGLTLRELGQDIPLRFDGKAFHAEFPYDDGSRITYHGTVADGVLDYAITATDGAMPPPCTLSIHATGHARFVFP